MDGVPQNAGREFSIVSIYDRRRHNFDRHAAYVVAAFVASG